VLSDAPEKQHLPEALSGSGQPADIDHLLPVTVPITPNLLEQATRLTSWQRSQLLPTSSTKTSKRVAVQKRDWAHVVEVNKPMKNFHTLVPNLARKVGHPSDVFFNFLKLGDAPLVSV
jgi:hypothetical protein